MSTRSNCKDTRLDDSENKAFSKIPLYNQLKYDSESTRSLDFNAKRNVSASGEELCYAVASSQLIDAYRFRQGSSLEVISSPLSIAVNHKILHKKFTSLDIGDYNSQSDADYIFGPGNPYLALFTASNSRICDQRWLEGFAAFIDKSTSTLGGTKKGVAPSVKNFLNAIFRQISFHKDQTDLLQNNIKPLDNFFQCRLTTSNKDLVSITKVVQSSLESDDPIEKAQKYLSELCKGNSFTVKLPNPKYYDGSEQSDSYSELNMKWEKLSNDLVALFNRGDKKDSLQEELSIKSEMDKLRDQFKKREKKRLKLKVGELLSLPSPVPIGVSYCKNRLAKGKREFCGLANHASVIIGQRLRNGKCELLIRNSYGIQGCKSSPYDCDNGSNWIPENDLFDKTNAVDLFWLE